MAIFLRSGLSCACYFLLLAFSLRSRAQSLLPESPVSSSLAGSAVALPDARSFSINPALAQADSSHSLRASVAYAPFVGGLKDAGQSAAEGIYYSSFIASSISFGATSLFLSDLYSDLVLYVGLSKAFSLSGDRKSSVGIRLRYESLATTPDYPRLHFLFVDIGFSLDLTRECSLAGVALNLGGTKYEIASGETERLDRRFLLGIAYHPTAVPLKLLTSVDEGPAQELTFRFGAEYDPATFLALRVGTSTDTGNISTGVGISYGNISCDVGSRFDKALGSIFSFSASGTW
ncbi:MAG: hypothetical protein Q8916_03915 [Bacteroidota bacterium]|nr:hypothetical protein [Bacteroidota bacterium]MDP4236544.1 hypothetical protein [Bacteroidota bacterium]